MRRRGWWRRLIEALFGDVLHIPHERAKPADDDRDSLQQFKRIMGGKP